MTDHVMASEIDAMQPGRALDVMVVSMIMGRKVKLAKGLACAWDGEGKPIMHGKDDWILEDYNPVTDGVPIPEAKHNPKVVFDYSNYDIGMTRVMDRMIEGPTLHRISLVWDTRLPKWVASVQWLDTAVNETRVVEGQDPKYARLAVYRACLKAILT